MLAKCLLATSLAMLATSVQAAEVSPVPGPSRFPTCESSPTAPVCRMEIAKFPSLKEGGQAWLDGDLLYISYKGDAKQVVLAGDFVPEPLPLVGQGEWLRVLRIKDPAQIRLRPMLMVTGPSGLLPPQQLDVAGPGYVRPKIVRPQEGQKTIVVESKHLQASRQLKLYFSPNYSAGVPARTIYVGDGNIPLAWGMATGADHGGLPPFVVVGVVPCEGPATKDRMSCRNLEYENVPVSQKGDPQKFAAHERFFIEEVIPAIEKEFNVSKKAADRAIAGSSGAGDWAASMAIRHPEYFSRAIVMSPSYGMYDRVTRGKPLPPMNFVVGVFEPDITRSTECLSGTVADAGATVSIEHLPYGHSMEMWGAAFRKHAAAWLKGQPVAPTVGVKRGAECRGLDEFNG